MSFSRRSGNKTYIWGKNMSEKFVIGIDYGTLSARAVICRTADGEIMAEHVCPYAHGVMSSALPDGTPLPPEWALEHPADYEEALVVSVRGALEKAQIPAQDVIGMAVDFTAGTILPLDKNGTPLCFDPQYASRPHAWMKLWKHHAAQAEADELSALCERFEPELLVCYGGRISAESMFPKLLQILHEDPAIYHAADRFIEACDYVTQMLTGSDARSYSMATYKALYREGVGYPDFLTLAAPEFADIARTKLRGSICPLGAIAGYLTAGMAQRLGLCPGIPVASAQLDGHAGLPALGIYGDNAAMMTLGTSSGIYLCTKELHAVKGACGIGWSATLPGMYGYASGQPGFGDLLAWFVSHSVPADVCDAARSHGISVHEELTQRAARLAPGETGLLALDWWNGNKSVLQDMELGGLMLGMTLETQPHEIYRALLESLAFGLRRIIQSHEDAGIPIRKLHVGGGIAYKNPLLMQIICDVTQKPMVCCKPVSVPAVGSCMFAATAAGSAAGGYDHLEDAIRHMHCLSDMRYTPNEANREIYDRLYSEYLRLHDYFGRGENNVMRHLKALAREQKGAPHD